MPWHWRWNWPGSRAPGPGAGGGGVARGAGSGVCGGRMARAHVVSRLPGHDRHGHAALQRVRLVSGSGLGARVPATLPQRVSFRLGPRAVHLAARIGPDRRGPMGQSPAVSPIAGYASWGSDLWDLFVAGDRGGYDRIRGRLDVFAASSLAEEQIAAGGRPAAPQLGMARTGQRPRDRRFGADVRSRHPVGIGAKSGESSLPAGCPALDRPDRVAFGRNVWLAAGRGAVQRLLPAGAAGAKGRLFDRGQLRVSGNFFGRAIDLFWRA